MSPIVEGRECFEYRWEQVCLFFDWNKCWSIQHITQSPFSISITIIHRTICLRVSAAIRIARTIICHRLSPAIFIDRSICSGIPVQYNLFIQYIARSWAQYMLSTTIWLSSILSIPIVILDVLLRTIRIELPSLNYNSLGRWLLLLWKAGYASSIGGSKFASFSAETSAGLYIMSYKAHFRFWLP